MIKKVAKKKRSAIKKKTTVKKRTIIKPQKVIIQHAPVPKEPKVDKVLIENFVSLQRVLTNLAVNLDNLTNKVSKLLELFEISAKSLAENNFDLEGDSTALTEKLDNLLDQNKTLARGMALMHERIPREQFPTPQPAAPPMPQMQPSMQLQQSSPYTKELPVTAPTSPQPQKMPTLEELEKSLPKLPPPENPKKTPNLQKKFTQETPSTPPSHQKFESPVV